MREPLIGDGGRALPRPANRPSAEDELIERRAARQERINLAAARRQQMLTDAGAAILELHRLACDSDDTDARGGGRVWVRTSRDGGPLEGAIDYLAVGVRVLDGRGNNTASTLRLRITAQVDPAVKEGWSLFLDGERVSAAVAREAVASVLLSVEDFGSNRDVIPFCPF